MWIVLTDFFNSIGMTCNYADNCIGDRKGLVFINLIEACVPAFEESLCLEDVLDSMNCLTDSSRLDNFSLKFCNA